MDSLVRFLSFSYASYLYVDGRIILVDEPITEEAEKQLELLPTIDGKKLFLVGTDQLAADLELFLEETNKQEENPLFVFPGNGSIFPKAKSETCRRIKGARVYAKRVWHPGLDPIAFAGQILPDTFMHLGVKTIVVVDDVISSGKTLNKLYQNNSWRFPKAKWIGAAWMSQIPTMKSDSGVNGYKHVNVACVVEGPNKRKVPINSLSTLRQDSGIAKDYAKRHFSDADAFLEIVNG